MSKNSEAQKATEHLHVNFLIDWLKLNRNRNFIIEGTEPENSKIDVKIKNFITNELSLIQCVELRASDTSYQNIKGCKDLPDNNHLAFKLTIMTVPHDINYLNEIKKVIKDKEKYYDSVKELILLIQVVIPDLSYDVVNSLDLNSIETDFKGCYVVQIPYSHHPQSGYVFEIKNGFID